MFCTGKDWISKEALRMTHRVSLGMRLTLLACVALGPVGSFCSPVFAADSTAAVRAEVPVTTSVALAYVEQPTGHHAASPVDYWSLLFVLALSTLIGLGVIVKVSRLLHTPLMSLTNAISAIAVVGAIIVTGEDHSGGIRVLGFIALFASMTNIVSGFLITDRMLKMFKQPSKDAKP